MRDKMVALVEWTLALHKELRSAGEADRTALEKQIAETDAEIDALVYELYGLTEIVIVKESDLCPPTSSRARHSRPPLILNNMPVTMPFKSDRPVTSTMQSPILA